jgi:hypothetical protein
VNGGTTLLLTLVLAISMSSATLVPDRKALASVMAVDAADYMPTAANLPAGYREVAFDVVNDELESTIAFRRAFVTLDGNGRVAVDVSLGTSEHDAHKMLNRRVSQLSPYYGWRITPMESFGEGGYRGTGSGPDGSNGAMIVFRIQAVVAEIMVGNSTGGPDILLMDNLARLVERRISSEPSAVAYQPGRPVEPVQFPGREPVVIVGTVSAPNPENRGDGTGGRSASPDSRAPTLSASAPVSSAQPQVNFSGRGTTVTPFFHLNAGLAVVHATHRGRSNFIVHLVDSSGQVTEFLVNEIGVFDGRIAVGIEQAGNYLLTVDADGDWRVEIGGRP